MTTKNKVPQIRFKGFSEVWEKNELGNKVEFFSGLTYSPNNIVKEDGTLVLRSSNVKDGRIVNADNVYVNSDVVNCNNVLKGDIAVVVRNGSRSLIGKHAQIQEEMTNTVIGAFMTGIRSEQPSFINALLDSPKFYKEIEKNLGATINQITTGAFKKMTFSFPKQDEQIKIGDYFQQLDKLIEQKAKKYKKLKQFKKAMLDKMFPKNGADTPEIRFKGFSGKWELIKFKELANVKRGLTYKPSDICNIGIKVLRSSNINEDIFIQNEDDVYVKEEAINIEFINEFDILITSANGSSRLVGKHAIVQNLSSKAVHGGFMLLATSKSPFFLNASMSSHWYKKFINKFVSGGNGAIGNLSKSDLDEQEIHAPKIEEQQKIGNYFYKLDKQIDLQQKELEKLKNIKKASLDKMFV